MVRHGWALAYRHYSMAYVADKEATHSAGASVRCGAFEPPWQWRRHLVNRTATGRCVIKGNINCKGERIYHVPLSQYYTAEIDLQGCRSQFLRLQAKQCSAKCATVWIGFDNSYEQRIRRIEAFCPDSMCVGRTGTFEYQIGRRRRQRCRFSQTSEIT